MRHGASSLVIVAMEAGVKWARMKLSGAQTAGRVEERLGPLWVVAFVEPSGWDLVLSSRLDRRLNYIVLRADQFGGSKRCLNCLHGVKSMTRGQAKCGTTPNQFTRVDTEMYNFDKYQWLRYTEERSFDRQLHELDYVVWK
jgi:hypothetical protein